MTRAFFIILSVFAFCSPSLSAQACNVPGNISAMATSSTNATLAWDVVGLPVGAYFQMEIVESGQNFIGLPDSTSVSGDSILLRNLKPSTQYRFKIRTVCGVNMYSPWSATATFRTYLSNPSHCGLNFIVADNSCQAETNQFPIEIKSLPGQTLGQDIELRAVRIIFEHDWLIDVGVYLRAPDGTRVKLVDSIGSSNDNFGDPTNTQCGNYTEFSSFCTSTSIASPSASPPFIGTFLPKESLSLFNTNGTAIGTWTLEICDTKANNVGKLQFFELVFSTPNCLPPTSITVLDEFADGLSMEWDTTGVVADSVFIEIGASGFRPSNNKLIFGDTLVRLPYPISFPLTIAGLETFSALNAYVRYECSGFLSANTCVVPFFTACTTANLVENFDNQTACGTACGQACSLVGIWQNSQDDDVDWLVHSGSTPSASTGPSADFSGTGKYIYFESSGQCALNKKAELRTECILVDAQPNACNLTFAYHMKGSKIGNLSLDISNDGGQNWQTLWSKSGQQGTDWLQQNIDLSAFDGQTVVFRFVGLSGGGATGDMALDNIRFFGSSLAGPSNIFYADADDDGFGDELQTQNFCLALPPAGFSAVAGDCDDTDNRVFPGANEVLCNGVDENCNGMMDDTFIASPSADADSTCLGGTVVLQANDPAKGMFYWFDATNRVLLGTGNNLTVEHVIANQSIYLVDSIAASTGGCASEEALVTIEAMPIPNLSLAVDSNTTCAFSPFDLMANSIFDSIQSSPKYLWHMEDWTPIPSGIVLENTAGFKEYFLVGQTAFGCGDTTDFFLTIQDIPTAAIQQGDSIAICSASSTVLNGKSIGLGLPPFRYAWSNGLNFANIPVNSSAPNQTKILTLTVSDKNGCSDSESIKVKTLNSITNTKINAVMDVTACGGTDGSILLEPLDGQGPYALSWTGPQAGTTSSVGAITIDGLPQGAYRFTVTDNSNQAACSMVLPLIIVSAPGLEAQIDTVYPASCFGETDGNIFLNVNGMAPSYLWSDASTNQNLLQVAGGTYSVTVEDGACSLTLDNINIPQPDEIIIQTNQLKQVNCYGENSGLIELFVQGGTQPFSYLWSNGAVTDSLPNLPRGNYNVTVSDATNCSASKTFTVFEPEPLGVSINFATDTVPCFGDAKGGVQVSAGGGTGTYQYLWNTSAITDRINLVPAGTYSVTVADENGCTAEKSHTIHSPDPLHIAQIDVVEPTCFGVDDGEISLEIQGGTAPFSYKWNNTEVSKDISGLPSGIYILTITDAKFCKFTTAATVLKAPVVINPIVDTIQDVACFGDSTGQIVLTQTGGIGPYTYYWNQNIGTEKLENLPVGVYIARVVDAQGCQEFSEVITIKQPLAPLDASFAAVEMPLCFGDSTGSLGLQVTGGTAPYSYLWNGNISSPQLSSAAAGSYAVQILDNQNCALVLDTILENPLPISAQIPANDTIPCFGSSFGKLCLNASGGTGALSVQWSNGKIGACQNDLLPGQYVATVSDNVGCQESFGVFDVVSQNDLFEITDLFVQSSNCSNDAIAAVQVCVPETQGPYAFSWNAPIGMHILQNNCDTLTAVEPGHYRLTVTDGFGCTALLDTLITEPNALQLNIPVSTAINPSCAGYEDGSLCTAVVGGLQPYHFLWSNGDTTACIDNLPSDCYRCTVTDANGCTASISDLVCLSAPPALFANTIFIKHDLCSNNKGAISLNVGGGVPGNPSYFFDWSNGGQSQNLTNLGSDIYSLTITDHVGCFIEVGPFEVLPDPTPLITDDQTVTIQGVACKGEQTGRIEVFPQGGVAPYRLDWANPMVSSFVLENLPAGLYQATLTDGDLCTATYAVQVSEPDFGLLLQTSYVPSSVGQSDGSAQVSISGGTPPYAVLWDEAANNQTDSTAINLPAGFFTVVVTDSAGCTHDAAIEVLTDTQLPSFVQKIRLSPNPSDSELQLLLQLEHPQQIRLQIFNANGQKVLENTSINSSDILERISTTHFMEGFYHFQIVFESGAVFFIPFLVHH